MSSPWTKSLNQAIRTNTMIRWLLLTCCSFLFCLLLGSICFWAAPAYAFQAFIACTLLFILSLFWVSIYSKSSFIKQTDYDIHLQIEQPGDVKQYSKDHLNQLKIIQRTKSKPIFFALAGLIVIALLSSSLIKNFTSQSFLLVSSPGNLLKFLKA